ncbi:MAG TPA: hypothetical protein VEL31_11290 [Ktedonobacteraceae bacterium]|nr:hypothetical protein [Ktedonobacteraceae bacterium]
MKKVSWFTLLRAGLLFVLLTLFSAAVVNADSTPTVYYACVNNGKLKMISATDTCPDNQQRIFWNQAGPQGVIGDRLTLCGFSI